jgi:hypothetical protein
VLAVSALSVVLTGPGRVSVDALLGRDYAGIAWALASLIVGSIGASLQIANRHGEPTARADAKTA